MSDRIAVFNEGRIEQIGTPDGGLRAPGDRASSPASSASRTSLDAATSPRHRSASRRPLLSLRPEKIAMLAPARAAAEALARARARWRHVLYQGAGTRACDARRRRRAHASCGQIARGGGRALAPAQGGRAMLWPARSIRMRWHAGDATRR